MIELIEAIQQGVTIEVRGRSYSAIAKVLYTTEKSPAVDYWKVFLNDHHVLVLLPAESLIYFGKDYGDLGQDLMSRDVVVYEGRSYKIVAQDYQFVKVIAFGSPTQAEGEASFSDYVGEDDDTKVLSLAIVSHTSRRADVVADVVEFEDIKIVAH